MGEWVKSFSWIWSIMKVDIVFYIPAEIWESFYEKSGSWGMAQNAPGQSDCRIFKSSAFVEQNDEIV